MNTLNEIEVNSTINEIFATTIIKQNFKNTFNKNIELIINFPIREEVILKKFEVQIGDKKITSKILPKEKAEEKYSDSIASGNIGVIGNYTENNNYRVSIGNLAPNQVMNLTSEFIQMISQDDKSYEFNIIVADLKPELEYSDVLVTKEDSNLISTKFFGKINCRSKITRLISPINKINRMFSDDFKYAEFNLEEENKESKIKILFRTEEMNIIKLYEQYDPILNNYCYSLNFIHDSTATEIQKTQNLLPDVDDNKSYLKIYQSNQLNDTPGVFIFLIDQSGSMSGSSIKIAEKSIKLFLQSLPNNSYFDIIGFGSYFVSYTETPLFYNQENVNETFNKINNLGAELGGTEIYQPLDFIFKRKYDKFYSKNLFLLTDGEVDNSIECVGLIKKNNKNFKVHAIGIGSSVDKKFIEKSGEAGKGSFTFAPEVENLTQKVIYALNSALKNYLNNVEVEIEPETKKSIQYPFQEDNILICNNDIFVYSFILENGKILDDDSIIKFSAFDPVTNKNIIDKARVADIKLKLPDGNDLNKSLVGIVLKNAKNIDEKEMIDLSTRFQVASPMTSLFAELLQDNNFKTELVKVEYKKAVVSNFNNNYNNHSINFGNPVPAYFATLICNSSKYDMCGLEELEEFDKKKPKIKNKEIRIQPSASPSYNFGNSNNIPILGSSVDSFSDSNYYNINSFSYQNINTNSSSFSNSPHLQTDFFQNLISSQNMFQGSWDPTSQACSLVINNSTDIKTKLENYLLNCQNNLISTDQNLFSTISTTILVMIYLEKKFPEKKTEYMLIFHKAKKFLQSYGLDYENIKQNI